MGVVPELQVLSGAMWAPIVAVPPVHLVGRERCAA